MQSVSAEHAVTEQPKSAMTMAGPSLHPVSDFAPVLVEREALEAAVKGTTSPQQLEQLLMQYPATQLSVPELVLFCNQLGKVTNAASTTVRKWSQTQVRIKRSHACMPWVRGVQPCRRTPSNVSG